MATLALSQGPALRLNWPRIGALSGTLSLHLLVITLLLLPATAMQLMKPQFDVITAHWVEPKPPPVEEPDPPKPPVPVKHEALKHPPPIPAPARIAPPVESNPSSGQVESGPPSAGDLPTAAPAPDSEPTALAYLTRTRVPYPREAIALHQQGTVILRVLVGTDGSAQAVEIEKSSGSRALDNAARDAVRRWTFQAGTRNGISAALWARVPIKFDLQTL
ncbi:MAG TPA: energy transducer TonB [Rhodanobacteraceae bacterium]|jgi:protein TonB|nr:energy transducer TonB [Rhodanobacteraceae bacterium]